MFDWDAVPPPVPPARPSERPTARPFERLAEGPGALLSFDIEIANVFTLRPGEDLDQYAPFDISVAAAVSSSNEIRHWYARDAEGKPARCLDAKLAREVLVTLREAQKSGVRVCAWNGLSFDLRWLGHVAQDARLAADIALDLYDPMFQFATMKGFPIGLAAVADGHGIAQKKLMSADRAPIEWSEGRYQNVLDYVAGDCQMTNLVVQAIERERAIRWRTKKGDVKSEAFGRLRPVREVMQDPAPDQSWMSKPKPVEGYWGWMKGMVG